MSSSTSSSPAYLVNDIDTATETAAIDTETATATATAIAATAPVRNLRSRLRPPVRKMPAIFDMTDDPDVSDESNLNDNDNDKDDDDYNENDDNGNTNDNNDEFRLHRITKPVIKRRCFIFDPEVIAIDDVDNNDKSNNNNNNNIQYS